MTVPALHDAVAERLLPWGTHRLVPRGRLGQSVARVLSLGLVDHVALRSAAIDEALGEGLPQVVLLGAGLDARAYRLPALSCARVFEVDHPASQAAKLLGVRDLVPSCESLHHVAVDFVKDDLDVALGHAGHDASIATAWVIEGVTMYLEASVTERLLAHAGARSAPGSTLAMTYLRPPQLALPAFAARALGVGLEGLGEPLRAKLTPEAVADLLLRVGLTPRSDTCAVDWAARFGASSMLARLFRGERLVVASARV